MVNLVSHQVLSLHTPTHHYSTLTVYPYLYRRHIQFVIDLLFLYLFFLCGIPHHLTSLNLLLHISLCVCVCDCVCAVLCMHTNEMSNICQLVSESIRTEEKKEGDGRNDGGRMDNSPGVLVLPTYSSRWTTLA